MNAYAGIGSRETPEGILVLMRDIGAALARKGWLLRSGAAPGADSAFEAGCDLALGQKAVFLPWKGFQGRSLGSGVQLLASEVMPEAEILAAQAHPRWPWLKRPVRMLMARNVAQVLGPRLDAPVAFVLCWTPGGSGSGGTGQALRLAASRGIPVYDLGNPETLRDVQGWFDGRTPIPEPGA